MIGTVKTGVMSQDNSWGDEKHRVRHCQGMGKGVDMSVHIPQPREAFSKTEAGIKLRDGWSSAIKHDTVKRSFSYTWLQILVAMPWQAMTDMAQTVSGYQKLISDRTGNSVL